jgi:hypothetical protein
MDDRDISLNWGWGPLDSDDEDHLREIWEEQQAEIKRQERDVGETHE